MGVPEENMSPLGRLQQSTCCSQFYIYIYTYTHTRTHVFRNSTASPTLKCEKSPIVWRIGYVTAADLPHDLCANAVYYNIRYPNNSVSWFMCPPHPHDPQIEPVVCMHTYVAAFTAAMHVEFNFNSCTKNCCSSDFAGAKKGYMTSLVRVNRGCGLVLK